VVVNTNRGCAGQGDYKLSSGFLQQLENFSPFYERKIISSQNGDTFPRGWKK
jgi:hypothetical protein